ncbi:MAG: hypothetical protein RIQ81_2140 [Pseudomonadota bacterium]
MSPLADSAVNALSVYVDLGGRALQALAAGCLDDAMDLMERRKFVLHNFRVHDERLGASGLRVGELESRLAALGAEAMRQDSELAAALVREQAAMRDVITDLGNRRKIGHYRSGQTDRPVVEREV